MKQDHARTPEALNNLFRSGKPPDQALDGYYAGALMRIINLPVMALLGEWIASHWIPWKGKVFDAAHHTGINAFSRDSLIPGHILWPFYRAYTHIGPETYRAFSFRTYVDSGLVDRDCSVLKIDYNLKENPAISVRRVLDELVQIDKGVFLGKAHIRWWWGKWQTIAYFMLEGGTV